jgi:hypothetical protein
VETDLQLAQRAAITGAAVALPYFAALADLPQELKSDGSARFPGPLAGFSRPWRVRAHIGAKLSKVSTSSAERGPRKP